MKKIRIGTRGSMLALAQSGQVRDSLMREHPGLDFEIVIIKTTGDKILDAPLSAIGDKGLFTKEIEKELQAGAIDLAVHSMKDMPTRIPGGLVIGAVTGRLNPRDVLISKRGKKLRDMKPGDTIATSSLRRKAQLLAFRPGLAIVDMRGNVQSRLKKMREAPGIDGIVLAYAGVERLQMLDEISEIIPEEILLPAAGQAALAIEIRDDDGFVTNLVSPLNDHTSQIAVDCERMFLSELGGGCQVPIAALAQVAGDVVTLDGMVGSLDGSAVFRDSLSGPVAEHERIGKELARKLLDEGAKKILDHIYGRSE
ncbi:MAG: hydroxymethylbilane synthase [Spirochaetes bacterium RBG_13_51_14]|nr:MAG: hydroxymethylbilane synthase [Spirochaetes bacterium RBG_13_51_14]